MIRNMSSHFIVSIGITMQFIMVHAYMCVSYSTPQETQNKIILYNNIIQVCGGIQYMFMTISYYKDNTNMYTGYSWLIFIQL